MNGNLHEPENFPGHDSGIWSPVPYEIVATWPVGTFAENVAVSHSGEVYVSIHSHNRIDRFDPQTGKTAEFVRLPEPVAGLAFDATGALWVTGGTIGKSPGYIWRVDGGRFEPWVNIPDAVFLNGCTPHPDGRTLLVCESITGSVLAIDQKDQRWFEWLRDDRLRPVQEKMPGANGIKCIDGWAWVSVTSRDFILRTKIAADGKPGKLEVAAEKLHGDDFTFGISGTTYFATHAAQTVIRLRPDGQRETIAGPRQGVVGSTACAFGRSSTDQNHIYYTTTGGLRYPFQGKVEEAKLVRLNVGESGRNL